MQHVTRHRNMRNTLKSPLRNHVGQFDGDIQKSLARRVNIRPLKNYTNGPHRTQIINRLLTKKIRRWEITKMITENHLRTTRSLNFLFINRRGRWKETQFRIATSGKTKRRHQLTLKTNIIFSLLLINGIGKRRRNHTFVALFRWKRRRRPKFRLTLLKINLNYDLATIGTWLYRLNTQKCTKRHVDHPLTHDKFPI